MSTSKVNSKKIEYPVYRNHNGIPCRVENTTQFTELCYGHVESSYGFMHKKIAQRWLINEIINCDEITKEEFDTEAQKVCNFVNAILVG